MKKVIFFLISILLLSSFYTYSQNKNILNLEKVEKFVIKNDLQTTSIITSPIAERAILQGEVKGEFKNVTYQYKSNVAIMKPVLKNNLIQHMSNNGLIKTVDLGAIKPHEDSIYVDPESDLVFQPVIVSDTEIIGFMPRLKDVFEDIEVPLQEVKLTLANTEMAIDSVEVESSGAGDDYDIKISFEDEEYTLFEDNDKTENSETKIEFKVKLDGYIGFNNPRVEGKYSKNGGYKLVFKTEERIDLKVSSDLKLEHEQLIPIYGFDIPVEKIGNCKVGVFLVIAVNGEVTLVAEVDQGINFVAGIRGGTFWYIPKSVSTVHETTSWCDVDYQVNGKIKALAGVECKAKLKFKGYNVLDLRVRGGLEANVEVKLGDTTALDANMGFRVKADGKIVSKKFTIYDELFVLWEKSTRNFGAYKLAVTEACAYNDRVKGKISNIADLENPKPYVGEVEIFVTHKNGVEEKYEATTTSEGKFSRKDIQLVKGDLVSIKIDSAAARTDGVKTTIPFQEIKFQIADYYADFVRGSVNSKVNTFDEPKTVKSNPQENNLKLLKPNFRVTPYFMQPITYQGKIEIIVQPLPQAELIAPLISIKNPENSNNNISKNAKIKRVNNSNIKTLPNKKVVQKGVLKKPMVRTTRNKDTFKNRAKKYVKEVVAPLGFFEFDNIAISPMDKVKARINIDGFIIESDWFYPDGLLFMAIENEGLETSVNMVAKSKTLTATNSTLMVSALRSNKAPVGNVRVVKGIDMKHNSIQFTKSEVFKNAVKPITYFDKQVVLEPCVLIEGMSLAKTGSWTATIVFNKSSEIFSPWAIDGHQFEYVSYIYEGRNTGYKFYQEECAACNNVNVNDLTSLLNAVISIPKVEIHKVIPSTAINHDINMGKLNNTNMY
ncbi:hypothetical protein R3X25_14910 [Lutibacter sp. TH_r2]|uniref:hypothetical protein n=1 Tax=Lutibacter sp. TH_r2 TaxID=3082083 RepID=UPI0029535414|nr:hypothetical protein [Lutibacter sp. TH_r2]MDV7188577.1 hypothetical protein [Lutibacter sp. TH_r2]